jgi:hypothetical protein
LTERTTRFRERWERSLTVLRAPRVRIEIYGDPDARAVYQLFTSRHPRFKITTAKRWGVALLRLPDTFDAYLAGCSRLLLRRRRRAESEGFKYGLVLPLEHLDEIVEINRSAPRRQGRPMTEVYVDRDLVAKTFEANTPVHGILSREGRLRAYAVVIVVGDAYVFSYLLGHADDLGDGIMYLLMSEILRSCIEARRSDGTPTWLMCDTFWGASKGLAFFKERAGFAPHTVDWVWIDRPGAGGSN